MADPARRCVPVCVPVVPAELVQPLNTGPPPVARSAGVEAAELFPPPSCAALQELWGLGTRGGSRAVTSQPHAGQSTSYGDVKSAYRGAGGWDRSGCAKGAPRSANRQGGGGGATQTQRTWEPHQEGRERAQQTRRRSAAMQERQPGQGTRMEGMGERAHGRQRQQRGWPGQPAPSLPGARATPAEPASGGGCLPQPRWAVCATAAEAHQGQTSRDGERDIWWTVGTTRGGAGHLGLTHTTHAHNTPTQHPHTTPPHNTRTQHPHTTPPHNTRTQHPHTTPPHNNTPTQYPHTTPPHNIPTQHPNTHGNTARQVMDGLWTEAHGQQKQSNDAGNNQHNLNTSITGRHIQRSPGTPTTGLRERGNNTSRSTGRSGRQNAATQRNMRREERVTVQGPVKKQQPDGMSPRGAGDGTLRCTVLWQDAYEYVKERRPIAHPNKGFLNQLITYEKYLFGVCPAGGGRVGLGVRLWLEATLDGGDGAWRVLGLLHGT